MAARVAPNGLKLIGGQASEHAVEQGHYRFSVDLRESREDFTSLDFHGTELT
jgi:hypothetical protein